MTQDGFAPNGDPAAEQPVVRDKRKIDPATGAVRPGAARPEPGAPPAGPPGEPAEDPRLADLAAQVAERTADLQRLQAEYVNYRRRVERDREAVRELAVMDVLAGLLPVLDDIGRARDHGELTGGFKAVGEALEAVAAKHGLQSYGEVGEIFDPMVHEALTHAYSDEVAEPTCVAILQTGYRVGNRIVRPARVAVAEPEAYDPTGGQMVQPPQAAPESPADGADE